MISQPTPEDYFRGSLEILETAVNQYRSGRRTFYRVAALQLRLLLCDSTRRHNTTVDISLAPQIVPRLRLPALDSAGQPKKPDTDLPLPDWLGQTLPLTGSEGEHLSIRTLIRRVCDQDGGAHVDPKPNAGLYADSSPAGLSPAEWIVRLSEIVLAATKPFDYSP